MKKFTLSFALVILSLIAIPQTPQAFNYQAIARESDGDPIINQAITAKISILSGSASGIIVYSELHNVSTNSMGLFTLEVGNPDETISGNFEEINWGVNIYFMKVELDENGGYNFTEMGTTQLLSVPYALWSENTANPEDADADPQNELQTLSQEGDQVTLSKDGGTISVSDADNDPINELQSLSQAGDQVTLSEGGGTITVSDADNDPANEIQTLTKEGNIVSLSLEGGSFTDEVDDADYNPANELNTSLVLDGTSLELTDTGGTLDADLSSLIDDADADPLNEFQTVTEADYEVTLSDGGGTFMTGVKSYTQAEIDAMTPYNGLTVHNSTSNCINYYYLNNWFEACGTCTPMPSQAQAGEDQAFYDNTITATLEANTPEQGTGAWAVATGTGGSFDDATNPETTFTGQPCITYTLAWTITNTCGSTVDNVEISFFATPTGADAGNDTIVGYGPTSVNLYANTPETGEGLWMIISGDGGILDDATNPSTLFSGIAGETYTLEWMISTACDTSADTLSVIFENIQIGGPYQGGIIAYILQSGDPGYIEGETHGIIAAASDHSTSTQWGCFGTTIPGADGTALGTGLQNTLDIVAGCSAAGIAAQICNDLELNGYDDWYLPGKDELNKLYLSKDLIGSFAGGDYWSSSECSNLNAWRQYFDYGSQSCNGKNYTNRVRAVRAF